MFFLAAAILAIVAIVFAIRAILAPRGSKLLPGILAGAGFCAAGLIFVIGFILYFGFHPANLPQPTVRTEPVILTTAVPVVPTTPSEVIPTATSPSAPSVATPAPAAVDYDSVCWAQSPDEYRAYLASKATKVNGLYEISYADLKAYADSHTGGFWQFEGRLPQYDQDRTDIFIVDLSKTGNFQYREGSFWYYNSSCIGDEGKIVSIDRTAAGKWQGRVKQNLIKKFTMVLHFPSSFEKGWTFTEASPYSPITGIVAQFIPMSCDHLVVPLQQDFYGQIDGQLHNFSFGAVNCRSVTIGNFPAGYEAQFYLDAKDNIQVTADDKLAHWIFPKTWTSTQIKNWVLAKYPNIAIDDPEGVVK